MFKIITKRKLRSLEARIEQLEAAVAKLCDGLTITVERPQPSLYSLPFLATDTYRIADVVELLLDKLGYRLEKTPAKRAGVRLAASAPPDPNS